MKLYLEYVFGGNFDNPVSSWQFIYFTFTALFLGLFTEFLFIIPDTIKWGRVGLFLLLWTIPTVFHIKGFINYIKNKEGK